MIAKFFIIFFSLLIVLALIGFWMKKRNVGDREAGKDGPLSEKNVSNVNDLNDLFNRARYMDRDEGREQG